MNDKIKPNEKERDEFFRQLGSENFSLQGRIAEAFGNKQLEIYFKLVEFTHKIVIVIGLVAGFGFTALNSISDEGRSFFVVGEALLFAGIVAGIYFSHYIYASELFNIQESQRKHRKHFKKRNDLFKKVWEGMNLDGASRSDMDELQRVDNESVKLFEVIEEEDDPKELQKFKSYQRTFIHLLIGGCVGILYSILI